MNKTVKENKSDIELIEHHICSVDYGQAICGTIKNNTDKKYSYVQISANFYDSDGTQVGNNFDNENDLEPNGKLRFQIGIEGDDVKTYKITEITGY